MQFSYDYYGRLKESKMFLANPQKDYLGTIVNAKNIKLNEYFNNISELSFIIYEKENGEYTDLYDKIVKMRLIEVQYVGWFQILSAKVEFNEKGTYKNVTCCFLENALIYRKIHNLDGVYSLYNILDTSKSLLHIISAECGWGIGHVSNVLLGKYRTLDIDSEKIYNLLTSKLSESFGCVFIFDVYSRTINAYALDEIGELTDIIISKKNILKEYIKDDSSDMIITKLKAVGGSDGVGGSVDFRSVNPTGMNYLINLDYFMNSDEDWVSPELKTAYLNYQEKYDLAVTNYTVALETYKALLSDLTALENELDELNSLQSAQYVVWQPLAQQYNGVPTSGTADYTVYMTALNSYNLYFAPIANKNNEITTKKSEISIAETNLNNINVDLSLSSNFTSEQLSELNMFITEDEDFQDETFIITDTMSSQDVIDMKLELMQNTATELVKISRPQYTISTKLSNFYTILDDRDSLISYSEMRDKLKLGNLITIKFSENYYLTVRLIKIIVDFDNPSDVELIFSNKDRLDDQLVQFAEIIANAGRTSNSYSISKYGYDSASSITNEVRDYMTNTLNATLQNMASNDNQELLIDTYGLHLRKWLPDQNEYSPYQAWWSNNTLLFTDSAWADAKGGIGVFTNQNGEKTMSVFAEVICGNLIMSENLFISNSSGTYTINNSGFTASAVVNGNAYAVGINPSIPSEIINVKINGSNVFYLDTTNNKLVMKGEIDAQSGNISGNLLVSGSLTGGTFYGSKLYSTNYSYGNTGMYINLSDGTIDTKNFKLSNTGILTCVDGNFTGTITATGGNIAGFSVDTTQLTSGTGNKFIRISPYSTTPGTRNYTTDYGAIDLGLSSDGYDTVIHLRSDGYARFGLPGDGKCLKLNYVVNDDEQYSIYTSGFKVNSGGMVYTDYIGSTVGKPLVLDGANGFGLMAEAGSGSIWGRNIDFYNHLGGVGTLEFNGYTSYTIDNNNIIHMGNLPNTYSFTASLTANGNVRFLNQNAACVTWCQDTFEYKTSSDFRLKKDITSLDDIPNELYLALKPQKFKFKCDPYNKTINFGLIAQEVKSAFERYGLNADDYKIIEYLNVRDYTDEGLYVNDKINAVDYKQLITWTVKIVQELYRQDEKKSNIIESLLNRIELIEKNNM